MTDTTTDKSRLAQADFIPGIVKPRALVAGENPAGATFYSDGTNFTQLAIGASGSVSYVLAGVPAYLAPGSANQVLAIVGGVPTWVTPTVYSSVLNRNTTQISISNTTTETDILSYSVAGGTLGTTGVLRATIIGTYLNNSGGAANLTINLKYGATTVCTSIASNSASSTDVAGVVLTAYLYANTSAAAQKGAYMLTGRHQPTNQNNVFLSDYGTATEDSTATKTFALTVTHGTASSDLTFTKEAAIVELL